MRYGLLVDELSRLFIQSLTLADNAVGYQSASETVNLFIRQVRPFLALRNGRYDFFYEGFRAAAKDRYESTKDELPYRATSQGWHRGLSDYFYQLPLWAGKDEKGNDLPNRRKVSELLYHLTKGEKWARVEEILTDLYFIDAKCKAGMTYELIMDYNLALDGLPEAQKEKEEERKHDERMQRYIREMIEYAKKWNDARCRHYEDPVKNPMPKPEDIPLPEIISSVRLWTNEEIMRDTERIRDNPNRLDKVELFAQFVNAESHNFVNYASQPMFCIQQAYNHADSGPIHEATRDIYIKENDAIVILLKQYSLSRFNPHPACVHTLEGHSGNVIAVGIMPDARMVISESWDETLRIWDIQTGECLRILECHPSSDNGNAVSITPDGRLVVSGYQFGIRVWNLQTDECQHILKGHASQVKAVCITPDGRRAVSGDTSGNLRVWNLQTAECQRILEGHSGKVSALCITPNGRLVISGDPSGMLRVWDLQTDECQHILKGHASPVEAVCITPDGRRAVSGDTSGNLLVWDLQTAECQRILEGHSGEVSALCITPDGRRAISASYETLQATLRVWDLQTGECLRILDGSLRGINAVYVTPDGRMAVSGSYDKTLRVWDLQRGDCQRILRDISSFNAVCITPDGRMAVSGSWDKTLRVWDLQTGECLRIMEGHSDSIFAVYITPDGRRAVSGSWDKTLRVWDLQTGKYQLILEEHLRMVDCVETPDKRMAVLEDSDADILRILDLQRGECRCILRGQSSGVSAVDITPDGRRAVLGRGTLDHALHVWDLQTDECLRILVGHSFWVYAVCITPDGKIAISGGWDGTLRVWDIQVGECLNILMGHASQVEAVCITPDGRRAVSGDNSGNMRVWDIQTGMCIAFYNINYHISSFSMAKKDGDIVIGTRSGQVIFARIMNLMQKSPVVTATRLWLFDPSGKEGCWSDSLTCDCLHCGQRFTPEASVLDAIAKITQKHNLSPAQSPCLKLPREAWDDPCLVSACPYCQQPLKFNPFVVDNRERY